jgi:multimeric flavodoxin WrbA
MINGSPRKKNTYSLLTQIQQILKDCGAQTEILHLSDYEINHCKGCDDNCINKRECAQADGMRMLMRKISDSDALVLASPVYLGGVTSKIKAFIDRTNIWFHNPEIAGKPILSVVTTASTGIKETKRFFESFTTGLGGRKGGFIARNGRSGRPVTEKELSPFLNALLSDKKKYKPAMNEIIMFQVQKVLALKSGGGNRKFWEEKKWLDKSYFYDCNMNIAKKAFAGVMFKVISKAMNS